MCDTIAAAPGATSEGITLFGKNSDREPNEAQNLCHIPAQSHESGSRVECTYISIPQVERTNTVLLSKPFWMWGAEMGVNEHGLAIGNEAVFTKAPYEKGPALTGMDLLRLALERATTAKDGVRVITDLLERHGQGGNCGYTHKLYYHNSFLLADPREVWVLETAGPHWAAKQVDGVYAISNKITIRADWDLASNDLVDYAVQKKWCRLAEDFSFARCYSDFLYTKFSSAEHRCASSSARLNNSVGGLGVTEFFAILRDHGDDAAETFRPDQGMVTSQVCNHAGWGPIRISQSVGSLVSKLAPEVATHFVTGTAAPCTSVFKPIWIDTPAALSYPMAGKTFDRESLFWRHELLHRQVLMDYGAGIRLLAPGRDKLEADFVRQSMAVTNADQAQREAVSRLAFGETEKFEEQCLADIKAASRNKSAGFLYAQAWRKWNKAAGLTWY